MSERDFWRLTLRQFDALVSRHMASQEREDYRAGMICAILANIHRDEKKRRQPFTPLDFIPGRTRGRVQAPQTPEDMLQTVKLLNAAFGGVVKEV
ncbi:MAG: hypothetical protein M1489_05995 [Firmicutes bacterium]|nr:hypothetical protein [Bacillota bacterium]